MNIKTNYLIDQSNNYLLENWSNERRKKSFYTSNQNSVDISFMVNFNLDEPESCLKLADLLIEKSWINNEKAYLNNLISLVESKKISGI